ncbi:MAG: GWxTD domain-containing protein [Melioribacteraceae bacterium]|nr:GWxTD domain-containing protein [Melioribacteraceae bacterium]MCF8264633.1 GWxTD domain-containing protein [Melioribacteraceae bacterium]MCF8411993.1 GWxTD domain-containing protein [Melioribacteraceae bacterium]
MKKGLLILLLLASTLSLFAQEFRFEFDYARFKYDSTSSFLEIYYEFNQADLTVYEENGQAKINGTINVVIKNIESGEELLNNDWNVVNDVQNQGNGAEERRLIGLIELVVPEGSYNLAVTGLDAVDPSKRNKIEEVIEIIPYINSEGSISDIQLATNILTNSQNTESLFYKNTLEVTPNPSILYSENSPVMFYYSEFYNTASSGKTEPVKIEKLLYNSIGNLVYSATKEMARSTSSLVEIGLVNLKKLPTDTYNFVLSMADTAKKTALISSKKFFLYNPSVKDTTDRRSIASSYLSSEFAVYTVDECDEMFNYVKYIAAPSEKDQFEKLDSLASKREFLYNFWKVRDPNPITPVNELKDDYMQRVNYANLNFRTMQRAGYKTDRGRIYLLYGEPDQRDMYPNESDKKPYEEWFYDSIESGVFFIFGDVSGFGDYELLTSNKIGELRDDQYERRINQN